MAAINCTLYINSTLYIKFTLQLFPQIDIPLPADGDDSPRPAIDAGGQPTSAEEGEEDDCGGRRGTTKTDLEAVGVIGRSEKRMEMVWKMLANKVQTTIMSKSS